MLDAVAARTGTVPPAWLIDGGFVTLEAIEAATDHAVTVYAPVPARRSARDPHTPRVDDSPAVGAWRARMATPEAKALYRERAATAECVNALWKDQRGLHRLRVRGRTKVLCIALWMAVTHNLLRWVALAAVSRQAVRN